MYIHTLSLLSLVGKASKSWRSLMACHPSTVLSCLVSNDVTSFQPIHQLGVYVGHSPAPSGVRISRCLLSPDICDFPSCCHGNHVWQFEICVLFSSRRFGVSQGLVPWAIHASLSVCIGALCYRCCICLWRLYQQDFTPSVVFTPDACASCAQLCLVPCLASPFPVWLVSPFFSGYCGSFAL